MNVTRRNYEYFVTKVKELEELEKHPGVFPRTIAARTKSLKEYCKQNGIDYEREREERRHERTRKDSMFMS